MKIFKIIFVLVTTIIFFTFPGISSTLIPEITTLSNEITGSLIENNKKIVAVADLTDLEGNVNIIGRFLAEEISISLAKEKKGITIIDRNQLKKMLAEKNISITGILDPGLSKKIGEISGAEVILTGSCYPVKDGLYVSLKAIDVSTARIFGGTTIIISKNQVIDDLIKMSFKLPETAESVKQTVFTPQVKEAGDFIFILNDVQKDSDTVVFEIEITNNLDEARFLTIDKIRAIDDTGRTYYPASLKIEQINAAIGEEGKILAISRGIVTENFDIFMKENQKVKGQIRFRNISQRAKVIGFLELTIASVKIINQHGTFVRLQDDLSAVRFTDIPLSK